MKSYKQFVEEVGGVSMSTGSVAINAVGAGNIKGIGYGPEGEPGVRKAIMTKKILRRKAPNVGAKIST